VKQGRFLDPKSGEFRGHTPDLTSNPALHRCFIREVWKQVISSGAGGLSPLVSAEDVSTALNGLMGETLPSGNQTINDLPALIAIMREVHGNRLPDPYWHCVEAWSDADPPPDTALQPLARKFANLTKGNSQEAIERRLVRKVKRLYPCLLAWMLFWEFEIELRASVVVSEVALVFQRHGIPFNRSPTPASLAESPMRGANTAR
jgi:hypothetical protein